MSITMKLKEKFKDYVTPSKYGLWQLTCALLYSTFSGRAESSLGFSFFFGGFGGFSFLGSSSGSSILWGLSSSTESSFDYPAINLLVVTLLQALKWLAKTVPSFSYNSSKFITDISFINSRVFGWIVQSF